MTIIGGDQNGTFECPMQNAYFFSRISLASRREHNFCFKFGLNRPPPPKRPFVTPCKNCTHSRVLASLLFKPSPNRVSLSRFSPFFDSQFLFHHDAHLKRVSLSRFSTVFNLHFFLRHNFHLKRALPFHYAAQPRRLL